MAATYPAPWPRTVRMWADRTWQVIELHRAQFVQVAPVTAPIAEHVISEQLLAQMAHADCLVVALDRMRRLAVWLGGADWPTAELEKERRTFIEQCGALKQVRDSLEHFEAYATGEGHRQKPGKENPDESFWVLISRTSIQYGRHELRPDVVVAAADRFHQAVRRVVDPLLDA